MHNVHSQPTPPMTPIVLLIVMYYLSAIRQLKHDKKVVTLKWYQII